jgi:small subunit ribosomal protein S9
MICRASVSSEAQRGASDWTEHSHMEFSIRPSFFSPLHTTYKLQEQHELRRKLTLELLRAHHELSRETEGIDESQALATQSYRQAEMRRLSDELRRLSNATNIAECRDPSLMKGFYAILTEDTDKRNAEAEAFHSVVTGKESVYDHWRVHFEEAYANTPSLDPLHVIYSRGDLSLSSDDSKGPEVAQKPSLKGRPSLNSKGVAVALGYRKTSVAKVRVAPGAGRIFVNGIPYDSFFKDLSVRIQVVRPILVTQSVGSFDVVARVQGGGLSSMAQAVRHGLAKALTLLVDNKSSFKLQKLVLWDSRRVERKKPGRVKARKGFSYVRR